MHPTAKNVFVNDFDFIAKSEIAEKLFSRRMAEPRINVAIDEPTGKTGRPRGPARAFCPRCTPDVELVSFPAAALLFSVNRDDIDFRATSGLVHRPHNRMSDLMICSKSLFESFNADQHRYTGTKTV